MKNRAELANERVVSYVLRVWREDPPEARIVRVALTRLSDHARLGFADLESALRFLRAQFTPSVSKNQIQGDQDDATD